LPASALRIPLLALVLAAVFAAPAAAKPYLDVVPLPNGWQPEGIAGDFGSGFLSGSRATGAVWSGNLTTGKGRVVIPGRSGGAATGMHFDHFGRLYVSGAATGTARVYSRGYKLLRAYRLARGTSFINDVAVSRKAAFFTDSANPRLYVLRWRSHHRLPKKARRLPLTGDLKYDSDPDTIDLNGIVHAPGARLIAVQSWSGKLFLIDSRTGNTRQIDLGGATVTNGDGLLLIGRTLYVVQNRENQIAVVHLKKGLLSGEIKRHLTDPDLDVPTTIILRGRSLFAVNARFSTPATPTTPYEVVRVAR
jgi:sugar lactone lactonase YvrE